MKDRIVVSAHALEDKFSHQNFIIINILFQFYSPIRKTGSKLHVDYSVHCCCRSISPLNRSKHSLELTAVANFDARLQSALRSKSKRRNTKLIPGTGSRSRNQTLQSLSRILVIGKRNRRCKSSFFNVSRKHFV